MYIYIYYITIYLYVYTYNYICICILYIDTYMDNMFPLEIKHSNSKPANVFIETSSINGGFPFAE